MHAHNIFSTKIISDFDIPFVFDAHEYTSVYVRGLTEGVENILRSNTLNGSTAYTLNRSCKKLAPGMNS